MFMKTNAAVLAVTLLVAGAGNAGAAVAYYTDFASWNVAVPAFTSLAIPDPGSSGFINFGNSTASVNYGGVIFSTSAAWGDGDFFNVGPAFGAPLPVLSSQDQQNGVANILITLAAPVNAFGLNFGTFFGSDVTFKLSNGETLTLGSAANGYDPKSFFGVVDSNPFDTILLTSSDTALHINELKFDAAVAPIPEPATWVMLVLGFLGIGAYGARRSVRRVAAA